MYPVVRAVRSVLVVDDDDRFLRQCKAELSPRTVFVTTDVVEALEIAKQQAPELALVDLWLEKQPPPSALGVGGGRRRGSDGFDLVAALRRDHPDLMIVMITALGDIVRALDGVGAQHAVIGGIAIGIRSAVPRATFDVNVAMRSTVPREQALHVIAALGFTHSATHAHTVNLRHQNGEPVQIAVDPELDPMIDRAELLHVEGFHVRVVTTEDLIAMKERAAADPARRVSQALRDRADVELLRGDIRAPDDGW